MLHNYIVSVLIFLGINPDCNGYGICRIETNILPDSLVGENCLKAKIFKTGNGLQVLFGESEMNDRIFLKHFTREYFEVTEDYTLSIDLSKQLGYPEPFTIHKGKYEFHETNSGIELDLK